VNNLNRALSLCFIVLQTPIIFCRVTTSAHNFDSFLSSLNTPTVPTNTLKPNNSHSQIALFLQKKTATKLPAASKKASSSLNLQSFLQAQSNPLYTKGMAILNNKELLASYQKAISSIDLFFVNFSMKNLQHFHAKSAKPTNSLTSLLVNTQSSPLAKPVNHGDALASFLSNLSTTPKKSVEAKKPVFVLPPNL
jgi:hypothetical protein